MPELIVKLLMIELARHLGYMIYCKKRIKIMDDEARTLKNVTDGVQELVDVARNNFEVIGPHVRSWQNRVEKTLKELERITGDQTFADPYLRHSLGWKASVVAKVIRQLQSEGQEICKFSSKCGSLEFQSRMEVTEKILSVLKSENTAVVGICGTAGIGKTTIVQAIEKRAKSGFLFDKIAIVVVSQYTNVVEVQGQLASVFGLNLLELTDISERARYLRERIATSQRILLMLDNVWDVLDMQAVGIPIGGSCKVVVASRNEDVCDKTGSLTFKISPLSGEESWKLFKEIAGERVDSPNLYAREVAEICEGVPLDIIKWAWKLRNSTDDVWIDVLRKLRISAMVDRGYLSPRRSLRDMAELIVKDMRTTELARDLGYMIYYKNEIKIMDEEARNLKIVTDEVQALVDDARSNFEVTGPHVQSWQNRVAKTHKELERITGDQTFANPYLRHSLGRKASEVAKVICQLQSEGREICKFSLKRGSLEFQSRMEMTEKILSVLKSENTAVVGICGTAGIGKTTILQEIAKRAKSGLLFDEIAIIVVSKYTNVDEVRRQLASVFYSNLSEQTDISVSAQRLHERLANGQRILLMLDDVPDVLDMEAVGIPIGGSCKVVVASRNEDACDRTGSLPFKISPLSGEESWKLFKQIVGECVDSPNLYPIAREVAKICEGVPLDIINWGWKLRNSKDDAWIDVLRELRISAMKNISGVDRGAYSTIELTYNNLKLDKAKSLFRLCCRFSKDEEIEIELIIRYGLGQQWFDGKKKITLVEAREGVDFFIKELIKCELLVAGGNEGFVKVPDVAWYVGRDKSNGVNERNEYLLLNDSRSKESSENDKYDPYTTFPLYSNEMHELPDYLDCSGLKLLSFGCSHDRLEMSRDFFLGMKGLQVIDFRINILEPLPQSLKFLRNLRTLYLDFCRLGDISSIGDLRELEILSFFQSEIGVLPGEIKKLRKLKLLDLRCASGPSIIHNGVLSKLKGLEELYTGKYFDPYYVRRQNQRSAKAVEIMSLSCLKALQISTTLDGDFLRKFGNLKFKNLNEFDFSMFDVESLPVSRYHLLNRVALRGVDPSQYLEVVNELMKKTEGLRLEAVKVDRLNRVKLDKRVFANLKRLNICNSNSLHCIIDAVDPVADNAVSNLVCIDIAEMYNLTELCRGELPLGSFEKLEEMSLMRLPKIKHLWWGQTQIPSLSNLRVLNMQDCDAITSLFTSSAVNCLVQLRELKIKKCKALKEVVSVMKTKEMELPELKILSVSELPEFKNFCLESHHIAGATENLFSRQVSLANMEELDVRNLNIRVLISGDQMQAWSLNNLQVLRVFSCIHMVTVFDFQTLQLGGDMFNRLETMDLCDLPFLTNIWRKVPRGIQCFSSLKTLQVSSCGGMKMKYLLSVSTAKMLESLQDLTIRSCETIQEVVGTEEEGSSSTAETMDKLLFPKLTSLALEDLTSLQMFYNGNHDVKLQLVKKILITSCPRMKTFCSRQVTAPELERIQTKNYDLEEWVWKGDLNKTVEFLGKQDHKMYKRALH